MSTAHEPSAGGYGHGKHKQRKASRWPFAMRKRRKKVEPFQPEFHGLEKRMMPSTYIVTSTGDSGPGTLRDAIDNVNSGTDNTIDFNIGGGGPATITPLSPLPSLTESVLIDGASQPDWMGPPLIEIDGASAGAAQTAWSSRPARASAPSAHSS